MIDRDFYLNNVFPQLDLCLPDLYPLTRLDEYPAYHALADHRVTMLVALTGTGKTKTLKSLGASLAGAGMNLIPSRREIADWIAIPIVQTIRNEPLCPIRDRVQRFHYTRLFAEHVAGGMATAFSWLRLADSYEGPVISEGIRGPREIGHALRHFPHWTIIELSLHPLTRLCRLSMRRENFDQAAGVADVSFLPRELRDEASTLLAAGDITESALTIMAAEAENYGLYPYADGAAYSNYHCLCVDGLTPDEVAQLATDIIAETRNVNR